MTDPAPEEVLQEEETPIRTGAPVPVVVEGPVRVQTLPSPVWAMLSYAGVGTTPIQVLAGEPRRRKATIVPSAAARFGASGAQADAQSAAWPASLPLEMTHDGEVWARADTGTANIFVLVEYWTE